MRALIPVSLALVVCGVMQAQADLPPIVFVHGHGDDSAKWMTTMWRWESNGYPRDRLFAVRLTDPLSRTLDDVPEPHHSSTIDVASELCAAVTRALLSTGAKKVVLIGSSRGGLTIRNYVKNGGGAGVVAKVITCGTPNHGILITDQLQESEYNGRSRFITGLNAGGEVVAGIDYLALRSDKNDLYAQPDGRPAGIPVAQTGITAEGPALAGAQNVVLPGLDHRELAFDARAFAVMYRFVTGKDPQSMLITPEASPAIGGVITGFAGTAPTNRPLAGVRLRIFALQPGSASREAAPVYERVSDETGAWGPVAVDPHREYEFELTSGGATVDYFRSPFPRSSKYVNLRFRAPDEKDRPAGYTVRVIRPEGYLSKDRDVLLQDDKPFDGLKPGVPSSDEAVLPFPVAPAKAVKIQFRDEVMYVRPLAIRDGQVSVAELNED